MHIMILQGNYTLEHENFILPLPAETTDKGLQLSDLF